MQLKLAGSVLLLTILFLQAGGILIIYKLQQYYVQDEMMQNLNSYKTQFQKIVLSLSEYQKCKINAREITLHNKLYDVKSVNIFGTRAELLVLNDSREENILIKIAEFTSTTRQQNSVLFNNLRHLLSLSYLPHERYISLFIYPFPIDKSFPVTLHFISTFPEIPTPPPRD